MPPLPTSRFGIGEAARDALGRAQQPGDAALAADLLEAASALPAVREVGTAPLLIDRTGTLDRAGMPAAYVPDAGAVLIHPVLAASREPHARAYATALLAQEFRHAAGGGTGPSTMGAAQLAAIGRDAYLADAAGEAARGVARQARALDELAASGSGAAVDRVLAAEGGSPLGRAVVAYRRHRAAGRTPSEAEVATARGMAADPALRNQTTRQAGQAWDAARDAHTAAAPPPRDGKPEAGQGLGEERVNRRATIGALAATNPALLAVKLIRMRDQEQDPARRSRIERLQERFGQRLADPGELPGRDVLQRFARLMEERVNAKARGDGLALQRNSGELTLLEGPLRQAASEAARQQLERGRQADAAGVLPLDGQDPKALRARLDRDGPALAIAAIGATAARLGSDLADAAAENLRRGLDTARTWLAERGVPLTGEAFGRRPVPTRHRDQDRGGIEL